MKTSEYVSQGHPDRIADYISEYILDKHIAVDPDTRYALEVQIKDNHVTLAGEITSRLDASYSQFTMWVREALYELGYTGIYCSAWGEENTINPDKLVVDVHIGQQSPNIAVGVDTDAWGDQGIFFGYASTGDDFLPNDYRIAKELGDGLYEQALHGAPWGLDIKTQVQTTDDGVVEKVIVAAPCHQEDLPSLENYIRCHDVFAAAAADEREIELIINGTGEYIRHASVGDCGTTGRKLAVDFYGGNCPIGGGCPWTKDSTKADLSLNLYARRMAVEYIKRHPEHKEVIVQLACCIGRPDVSISIRNRHGEELDASVVEVRPSDLKRLFKLDMPNFTKLHTVGIAGWAVL